MYARVYVEILNRCNGTCSFCPGTKRPAGRMTPEQFTRVLEKLRGVTEYVYFHVMGEPLMHPDLPELIRTARDMGFHPAITTNGILLPKRGRELMESGIYKVNISVHSFEEGSEEAFRAYMKGCLDFADEASRAGTIVVLRLWNQGCDGGRNRMVTDAIREKFPWPWDEKPRGTRIQQKLFLEYGERFAWPDMEADDGGSQVFCYGLRDHFGILCDGTVIPCCLDHEGDIPLGNIFTGDIREILESPRAMAIREGFSRRQAPEELCRRCGYARRFG